MFKLHVHSQTGDIDEVVEVEGDTAVIGRSSDCQVVIDRKDISRRHATIMRGWVVDDLNSRNGTYVGGAKLETAVLVPSRSFQVGDPTSQNLVTIEVVSSERPSARAADESAPGATESGLHGESEVRERTTRALPADSEGSSVASLRAELEAETERYRYQCAKLEVELEALRRKIDSFQKGGGDRRPAPEKKDDSRRMRHDERP